jgi:hypothetical protein
LAPKEPFRRSFHLERKVRLSLRGASPEEREQFFALLDHLAVNPTDPMVGVAPVRDDLPQTYTAPFDFAVVMFQVLADYPVIWVAQITWLKAFLEGAEGESE